jgi:heptosyltransferase-2
MASKKFSNPLVIQPMPGIGDMLWFLPHIRAIADRFSISGKVSVLARPSSHAETLLETEPCIDRVIPLYRKQMNRQGFERNPNHQQLYKHDGIKGFSNLVKELKPYSFDAAWSLDRHAFYAYTMLFSKIPYRFGLGYGMEKYSLKHPTLPKKFQKTHARDRATEFLKLFNIDIQQYEYPLTISKDVKGKIHSCFKKEALWACIGIGASEIERKWPSYHFESLVQDLCAKGITCFICGGPQEKEEALSIKKNIEEKYQHLVHCINDFNVMETAALITESDFYVGNDTFLYNLAALQNKPSLAIGGTVPVSTYLQAMHSISNNRDINTLSPAQVLKALRAFSIFPDA